MRKRLSTSSIWLGLFAMLMIHVGPLYSALQMTQARAPAADRQHHVCRDLEPSEHGKPSANEPAWLAALELCGYCELLTLNPPLLLTVQLVLPRHPPELIQPLPEAPLRPTLRHSGSHPRAPPMAFHS